MTNNSEHLTSPDHSIGNVMIITLIVFCGLSAIFLLGIF